MQILNAVSCSDVFTDAVSIQNVIRSSGGYFAVATNDVFVALQYHPSGSQGQPVWTRETHAPVGNGVLAPGTTGVRFRNYVAGKVSVVSAALSEASEPPLTLVAGGASTPSGSSTYLGAFTLANWPPPAPAEGDVALLYGTNDGSTFAWLEQYQPTLLGSTYPWGPPPGITQPYSYKTTDTLAGYYVLTAAGWVYTGTIANNGFVAFTKNIPLAGIWNLAADAGFYDQTATADTVGVGVSSTSTVQPTAGNRNTGALDATGRGSVEMLAGQLTVAAANTNVFGWLNQTATAHTIVIPSFAIGIAPVQHA